MPTSLTKDQRSLLSRVTLAAREVAETAARAALENLAVHEGDYRGHMTVDQRQLRNRLRARGRALGDRLDQRTSAQSIVHLAESAAYEHWHRLLFTRFLAENHLLHTDAANGAVPVTLEECNELAPELGARDGFELACRFASVILPGVFRRDDPVLELRLAPNHEVQLRRLVDRLPPEIFRADDALGWTYQFWQAKRKDEINKSGVKIGADELPTVTQLFTEDYMVEFLLHNSIGAWWAGKLGPLRAETEEQARAAVALTERDGLPAITWDYLRFIEDEDGTWRPAAGTFDGWPRRTAEIRFLDPCMGSGHFLVFALPILARLRQEEEGLGAAEVVAAVLRDNLHGLEIDERCTQIAAFNVALTAWKFGGYQALPSLHLACSGLAPHASKQAWMDLADRAADFLPVAPERDLFGAEDNLFTAALRAGMEQLYDLFRQAPVLGSLIDPRAISGDLLTADYRSLRPIMERALASEPTGFRRELAITANGIAKALEIINSHFSIVATNVPFLGIRKQDAVLRRFSLDYYPDQKEDLATLFCARISKWIRDATMAVVTPENWYFLHRYRGHRRQTLERQTLRFMAPLGESAFESASAAGAFAALCIIDAAPPRQDAQISVLNVRSRKGPGEKASALVNEEVRSAAQYAQLSNPDSRLSFEEPSSIKRLEHYVFTAQGIKTGDDFWWVRSFWEMDIISANWRPYQTSIEATQAYTGRSEIIDWRTGGSGMVRPRTASPVLGKCGVAVSAMREIAATLYTGELHYSMATPLIPNDARDLAALWVFCRSPEYNKRIREIEQKVAVTTGTFLKVPFGLPHWTSVADRELRDGLPKPHSDDPSQWLFNGHPAGSEQPLQVAVARLLGYRWPRQTGSDFPDCPALDPDGLESHADADGIVCLPPINKEQPAAARLRSLLTTAFGSDWSPSRERDLLAATGAKQTNLEDWLRDAFFEQHCKLFHNRPFIWHIWDGRKDGFHALVNYHRLDYANLQKLTYNYLGEWIGRQETDAKADKPGAAERLGAARALEAELVKILEGESPYDIFVRWKPLKDQPIGWHPDLNDGVRLNIRPFMLAKDVGKKGAGILRAKPNIKWDKDRGKEPQRDKADYPWFWYDTDPPTDCPGGPDFTGNRWNNVHLTLARKRAARAGQRDENSRCSTAALP
jgi:hypothetical protein